MKYRTIVADPPWDVRRGPAESGPGSQWGRPGGGNGGASRPLTYPSMSVEEIAALPVRDLADRRAHLYLWTINAYVEDAYEIARLWGFRPSTLLTWCKRPNGKGLGGTYSLTTEFILFARRGVCPAAERVDTTWWLWPRGRHSAKPEAFMDLVERVSPAPRLELFARRQRLGWDTWGNEALCHVDIGGAA